LSNLPAEAATFILI